MIEENVWKLTRMHLEMLQIYRCRKIAFHSFHLLGYNFILLFLNGIRIN